MKADAPDGWLIEAGIGETRWVEIAGGAARRVRIHRDSDGPPLGEVPTARLVEALPAQRRAEVLLDDDTTAWLTPLPHPLPPQGTRLTVRVERLPIPERGRIKRAHVRVVDPDATPDAPSGAVAEAPTTRASDPGPDRLADAGWFEAIDAARTGTVAFPGGSLILSPTPAMTVIDIDGDLPPKELAHAGLIAAARAIILFGIGGSIAIDVPTLADKAQRVAAAAALDAVLANDGPFERTAINGFGLIQIVRPRPGPSLIEREQFAPVESAALALLRAGERAQGTGLLTLRATAAVTDWLAHRPKLTTELERRTGRPVTLSSDASLGLWSGHAQ